MSTESSLPVVDFKDVFSSKALQTCPQVQQIHDAFTKVGFVFITNHGIDQKLINKAFSVSMEFFQKPDEVKKKYRYRHVKTDHNGYIPYGTERMRDDPDGAPKSPKEVFEVCSIKNNVFPDEEVPNFRPLTTKLYKETMKVALKMLEIMGHALGLKDPAFFPKLCVDLGEGCKKNYTDLRCLYYPPFPQDFDFGGLMTSSDSCFVRLSEHVDLGMLTILFPHPQNVGGLQVKKADGSWIDVPYMPGAILVNLGEIMQRWTADKYIATPHRVIVPNSARYVARQSMVMFIHPRSDTIVKCLDGSNKYEPLVAGEHARKYTDDYVTTY